MLKKIRQKAAAAVNEIHQPEFWTWNRWLRPLPVKAHTFDIRKLKLPKKNYFPEGLQPVENYSHGKPLPPGILRKNDSFNRFLVVRSTKSRGAPLQKSKTVRLFFSAAPAAVSEKYRFDWKKPSSEDYLPSWETVPSEDYLPSWETVPSEDHIPSWETVPSEDHIPSWSSSVSRNYACDERYSAGVPEISRSAEWSSASPKETTAVREMAEEWQFTELPYSDAEEFHGIHSGMVSEYTSLLLAGPAGNNIMSEESGDTEIAEPCAGAFDEALPDQSAVSFENKLGSEVSVSEDLIHSCIPVVSHDLIGAGNTQVSDDLLELVSETLQISLLEPGEFAGETLLDRSAELKEILPVANIPFGFEIYTGISVVPAYEINSVEAALVNIGGFSMPALSPIFEVYLKAEKYQTEIIPDIFLNQSPEISGAAFDSAWSVQSPATGSYEFYIPAAAAGKTILKELPVSEVEEHPVNAVSRYTVKSASGEVELWTGLSAEQRSEYDTTLSDGVKKLQATAGTGNIFILKPQIYALLHQLNQILNFPQSLHTTPRSDELLVQIRKLHPSGERIIVFSQYEKMGIKRIEELLKDSGIQVFVYLSSYSAVQAQDIFGRFSASSENAVLVADAKAVNKKAGLREIKHAFYFDRWWNPLNNLQAQESFMQSPAENVYYFYSYGTIDERIKSMLERKGIANKAAAKKYSMAQINELITTDEWLEQVFYL